MKHSAAPLTPSHGRSVIGRACVSALLALGSMGAQAQNLVELFESARSFDASYLSARSQFDADFARAEQARAGLLPQAALGAGANWGNVDTEGASASRNTNSQNVTLSASQPLYRPANRLLFEQGQLSVDVARSRLVVAEQDLVVRTTTARTAAQSQAAYFDDRRGKNYSVTDGMGPLTDAWRKAARQTTSITTVPADATTTLYNAPGARNNACLTFGETANMLQNQLHRTTGSIATALSGAGGFNPRSALIPNIEDLQLRYAITRMPVAGQVMPQQVTAHVDASDPALGNTPLNWSRVAAVHICLVARSAQPVPLGDNQAGDVGRFIDCVDVVQNPADRFLRRSYRTTVFLRNTRPAVAAAFRLNGAVVENPYGHLSSSN